MEVTEDVGEQEFLIVIAMAIRVFRPPLPSHFGSCRNAWAWASLPLRSDMIFVEGLEQRHRDGETPIRSLTDDSHSSRNTSNHLTRAPHITTQRKAAASPPERETSAGASPSGRLATNRPSAAIQCKRVAEGVTVGHLVGRCDRSLIGKISRGGFRDGESRRGAVVFPR